MTEHESTEAPPAAPEASASTFELHGKPEEISKLLRAMGKARAQMPTMVADAAGQFQNRTFKYLDLPSIYAAAIPCLDREGVTVFHPNCQVNMRTQRATTILAGHGAMVEVSTDFTCAVAPENVKGVGSMFTYLNRYQMRGLCAVAGDDDPDAAGTGAPQQSAPFKSQPKPAELPKQREPEPARPAPAQKPPDPEASQADDSDAPDNGPLVKGSPTATRMTALLMENGLSGPDERNAFILKVTGKTVVPGIVLTYGDARKLMKALQ
jgi:hypothetical protein